jgi:BMFP domain-containing protein YqiC
MNDAAGAAQGVKRKVDTLMRNQAEKILRDLDVVKREEFEVVKDMARLAREENEALKARIAALEAKAGGGREGPHDASICSALAALFRGATQSRARNPSLPTFTRHHPLCHAGTPDSGSPSTPRFVANSALMREY